ncbi:chromate transporter [Bacillus sp. SA1-12]|uniref:chromate transporter n=1 Tax=Bacillus sp. SA1-12 TaxID=1455638 RepID=UPI000626F01F|nr:chromate transporter [Bacillus sp. SA1-12]KKI89442.1 chromate transporter [Bacillus sp. SA1-12]
MREEWKIIVHLFWTFFKISPITFGGGYAMLPIIEKEVVHKRNWAKSEDLTDVFAIAGTVPGAIAVNAATFVGHRIAGLRGAIAAALGTLTPTFIIVLFLSSMLASFQENPHVEAAFYGIRSATVALIVYAGIKMSRTSLIDKTTSLLAGSMFIAMLFFHWHPVFIILIGAILGILIIKVKEKLGVFVKLEKSDYEQNEEKEMTDLLYEIKQKVGL